MNIKHRFRSVLRLGCSSIIRLMPRSIKRQLFRISYYIINDIKHNHPKISEVLVHRVERYKNDNALTIAVFIHGGIGDVLMAGNYLKELWKYIEYPCTLDIFTSQEIDVVKSVFQGHHYIARIGHLSDMRRDNINKDAYYDAIISILRFPEIIFCDDRAVLKKSISLYRLIAFIKKFCKSTAEQFNGNNMLMVVYSLLNGQNRRSQADVGKFLEINDSKKPFLFLDYTICDPMEKFHLVPGEFITIQRGIGILRGFEELRNGNLRNWPVVHYESLIHALKQAYPKLKIVIVGNLEDGAPAFAGADLDLRGVTLFEELKIILKHSRLHIDGECGLVHLKNALNGTSAVFFGQTRIDFCGYPNNINISANACPLWCEYLTEDWMKRCLRGCDFPPCMTELTPDMAFQSISLYLDNSGLPTKFIKCERPNYIACQGKQILIIGEFRADFALAMINSGNTVRTYLSDFGIQDFLSAKQLNCELEFGDVHNIPESDTSCDAILWHIEKNEHLNFHYALLELQRVLKTGGTLEITYSGSENSISIIDLQCSIKNGTTICMEKIQGQFIGSSTLERTQN